MWARIDDAFPTHPKVVAAGVEAAFAFVCAVCYSCRYLTDGRVPREAIRSFPVADPAAAFVRLVEVGLVDVEGDVFVIRTFLEYNPSRAESEERTQTRRARAQHAARARWDADGNASGMRDAVHDAPVPHSSGHTPEQCPDDAPYPSARAQRARGTRCPDPFSVDEQLQQWATTDFPSVDWRGETRKFVDYWRAVPGARGLKLDWRSTWRNWIRRAAEGRRT